MKVISQTLYKPFTPISVTITFESESEAKAMLKILGANRSEYFLRETMELISKPIVEEIQKKLENK